MEWYKNGWVIALMIIFGFVLVFVSLNGVFDFYPSLNLFSSSSSGSVSGNQETTQYVTTDPTTIKMKKDLYEIFNQEELSTEEDLIRVMKKYINVRKNWLKEKYKDKNPDSTNSNINKEVQEFFSWKMYQRLQDLSDNYFPNNPEMSQKLIGYINNQVVSSENTILKDIANDYISKKFGNANNSNEKIIVEREVNMVLYDFSTDSIYYMTKFDPDAYTDE